VDASPGREADILENHIGLCVHLDGELFSLIRVQYNLTFVLLSRLSAARRMSSNLKVFWKLRRN
jgi:hypothetical protein